MAHLYIDPALPPFAAGDTVVLTGAEAKHAVTVSRLRPGEDVLVGDGAGLLGWGSVVTATPQALEVRLASVRRDEAPARGIRLVQALAKGDRDELAIQAATELGVDAVTPWAAARSVARWEGAKVAKGRDRWASIVHEASKQSLRARVPAIGELASTKQVAALAPDATVLVLEPTATVPLSAVDLGTEGELVLVVGPEGGIAPQELETFEAAGAALVRLGDTVLRTSTAGPAALAVLSMRLGRW
ncbi:16S rRNA (uracil(1498)-N(3))-methyltransferase [Desertivibrio insolitus]|uniref:16S rRNA (uracil(1498)-N(3))-methyltransferase n=1 Tax=Herbiconiux sp. SYSU D00978 TaxID=2812562 RepID=UPI001A95EEA0|nr:16S rRNA (uracil(1498)-N(3))-methyltransferase [Herbiconiux sp. SYSU D00978]